MHLSNPLWGNDVTRTSVSFVISFVGGAVLVMAITFFSSKITIMTKIKKIKSKVYRGITALTMKMTQAYTLLFLGMP